MTDTYVASQGSNNSSQVEEAMTLVPIGNLDSSRLERLVTLHEEAVFLAIVWVLLLFIEWRRMRREKKARANQDPYAVKPLSPTKRENIRRRFKI